MGRDQGDKVLRPYPEKNFSYLGYSEAQLSTSSFNEISYLFLFKRMPRLAELQSLSWNISSSFVEMPEKLNFLNYLPNNMPLDKLFLTMLAVFPSYYDFEELEIDDVFAKILAFLSVGFCLWNKKEYKIEARINTEAVTLGEFFLLSLHQQAYAKEIDNLEQIMVSLSACSWGASECALRNAVVNDSDIISCLISGFSAYKYNAHFGNGSLLSYIPDSFKLWIAMLCRLPSYIYHLFDEYENRMFALPSEDFMADFPEQKYISLNLR